MRIAYYNPQNGKIDRFVTGPASYVETDLQPGEEFYLNCPMAATHIINDEPVTIISQPTSSELLAKIRIQRNLKLSDCDWTQVADAPLTTEQKTAWATYRQRLRDFPQTCNPSKPVWPPLPQ